MKMMTTDDKQGFVSNVEGDFLNAHFLLLKGATGGGGRGAGWGWIFIIIIILVVIIIMSTLSIMSIMSTFRSVMM